MSIYDKLIEMDGDRVYSLSKDLYYTVLIQHNEVYLEARGYLPVRVFRDTVEALHLCPVYLGPMFKEG